LGVVAVLIWFLMFRKKRHRKKRRHHQRESRQLNPTLAQVGGLPPIREEDEPPGQSSSTAQS
jgi:preprotein translocase subunit YajC